MSTSTYEDMIERDRALARRARPKVTARQVAERLSRPRVTAREVAERLEITSTKRS